jgi:hypothetical protein
MTISEVASLRAMVADFASSSAPQADKTRDNISEIRTNRLSFDLGFIFFLLEFFMFGSSTTFHAVRRVFVHGFGGILENFLEVKTGATTR